jgi:hypothetical protein
MTGWRWCRVMAGEGAPSTSFVAAISKDADVRGIDRKSERLDLRMTVDGIISPNIRP